MGLLGRIFGRNSVESVCAAMWARIDNTAPVPSSRISVAKKPAKPWVNHAARYKRMRRSKRHAERVVAKVYGASWKSGWTPTHHFMPRLRAA
jgi:hypothetical protein